MTSVPRNVFVDTSFWFAALEAEDVNHDRATRLLEKLSVARTRFHATREIVGETLTLLRYRSRVKTVLFFVDQVLPTVGIVPTDGAIHATALEVFRRLASRRRLSYCDALSFVVVRQTLDDMPCLAFDRDFRALGLTVFV